MPPQSLFRAASAGPGLPGAPARFTSWMGPGLRLLVKVTDKRRQHKRWIWQTFWLQPWSKSQSICGEHIEFIVHGMILFPKDLSKNYLFVKEFGKSEDGTSAGSGRGQLTILAIQQKSSTARRVGN